MLYLLDLLQVAAPEFAALVGKGAGEHHRELRAGVPVQRQPTGSKRFHGIWSRARSYLLASGKGRSSAFTSPAPLCASSCAS